MVEQPVGVVTLVFTDIEGSTRLLQELGREAYRVALAEHRRVVRLACARHDGYEVDYEGDSFFFAFGSAVGAVAAAAEALRGLAASPVRLRVGIHTGEPGLDPPKYVGLDVHLAARVMAAAHGGQVLLTAATRQLIGDEVLLLGEHRLRDLAEPVVLYQLGRRQFPPVRTLHTSNLPLPPNPLLGRERELAELLALLRCEEVRLVTLTGAGGCGKTRLALAAARELLPDYPHGVFFVSLAALRESELLLPEIIRTLGAAGSGSPTEVLCAWLAERRVLLLLDNFEQLLAAGPAIAELLAAAAGLRVLVTSRASLRLSGEHEYHLPPLGLPRPGEHDPKRLASAGAVALFLARARAARASFELTEENAGVVAAICRAVDGLPLALELAAARIRVLSAEALLARLGRPLELLGGGARDLPSRQQTLRTTIEWSYQLLGHEEQGLLAALSVFAGGCTVEAVEAVCGGEQALERLTTLIESNLVHEQLGLDGEPRFTLLETIHEFARERLPGPQSLILPNRHADYYLEGVETALAKFRAAERGHLRWLSRIDAEHDNMRAALTWYAKTDTDKLLRFVCAGALLWTYSQFVEGARWVELALARSAGEQSPRRASVVNAAAISIDTRGDHRRARELFEEALALYRQHEDRERVCAVLVNLAVCYHALRQYRQAQLCAEEALELAHSFGDERRIVLAQWVLGSSLAGQGQFPEGLALLEDSLQRLRALDWSPYIAGALITIATIQLRQGRQADAHTNFAEVLEMAAPRGWAEAADALVGLAAIAAQQQGRTLEAARLLAAGERLHTDTERELMPWLPWLEEARAATHQTLNGRLNAGELEQIRQEIALLRLDEVPNYALAAKTAGGDSTEARQPPIHAELEILRHATRGSQPE